jgi:hypothetical protein
MKVHETQNAKEDRFIKLYKDSKNQSVNNLSHSIDKLDHSKRGWDST